jgi:hypothetical protein
MAKLAIPPYFKTVATKVNDPFCDFQVWETRLEAVGILPPKNPSASACGVGQAAARPLALMF